MLRKIVDLSTGSETMVEVPLAEQAQIRAEAEAYEASITYADRRRAAYPSLQEQLDMQYRDALNGTTEWLDAIAAVKAQFPKPV